MAARRPAGVTLVAVLTWISGALQVLSGILTLTGGGDATSGWVRIVIGVITVLVSFGLFGGSRGSRVLVTIVLVLNLASAVWAMFVLPGAFWPSLVQGLVALIGIGLLYTRAANSFFRG